MGRPSNRVERRAEIVEGLMKAMAAQGYEAASIKDIAAAAGLSPGLVHHHFGAKKQVLLALVAELGARLDQRLAEAAEAADSPRAALHAVVKAALSLDPEASPQPEVVACWIAVSAEAARQPEVAAVYAEAIGAQRARLAALFEAALLAEGRDPAGADACALALLAAIQGCITLSATLPVPAGFAAPRVSDMLDGLLGADPAADPAAEAPAQRAPAP